GFAGPVAGLRAAAVRADLPRHERADPADHAGADGHRDVPARLGTAGAGRDGGRGLLDVHTDARSRNPTGVRCAIAARPGAGLAVAESRHRAPDAHAGFTAEEWCVAA